MKYVISHGHIVQVIYVEADGIHGTLFGMYDGRVEASDNSPIKYEQLPLAVQTAISLMFETAFKIPEKDRSRWLEAQMSIEVESCGYL